jgi:two-component system, OmpR family, phosphate regulon sensor histidine kinase PhoR
MKIRSLFWKISIPVMLILAVGMAVSGLFVINSARNAQLKELRSYLVNESHLLADISEPDFASVNGAALDGLAKTTGQQLGARVTLIALDGTVLGDSWEDPATLENHSNRPEVIQALATGVGVSTRYSTTVKENLMYAAVPVLSNGRNIGVARVALPLTTVRDTVGSATRTIIITLIGVAALIAISTLFITRRITSPLRQITRATEEIASGDLNQSVSIRTNDELGKLGLAFNEMASRLSHTTAMAEVEKSRLEAVLANLADGIVMTDAGGKIVLANPATSRLFGFQSQEAKGRSVIEVLHDHEIHMLYRKCLASGHEESARIDSRSHFLQVIAAPLPADRPGGAILLFQDLTQLYALQTMRQEFVANVSHELRTPLAGIKAMTETLQEGALKDESVAGDFLGRINGEVDKLTQMVNELMELSRIETGGITLKTGPTDLNLILKEAARRFAPQAERKKQTIGLNLDNSLPAVPADGERINEVVNNILHNAVKFTPEGGTITLSSTAGPDSVTVSVADTGIGISDGDLPHVFERFYKADKSRTQSGTGLGLAIAKHIIQAHGGRIWAASEPGRGSTFSFSLPLKSKI